MNFFSNIFSVKTESYKNRVIYLDFVRGILILLVLYHHSMSPYNEYILQFHMPALFVLSGYTEYTLNKDRSMSEYIKSKFFRLVVPYLSFEVLNFILFSIRECLYGNIKIPYIDAFISIVTCVNNSYVGLYGRLWFIPAIFVCSIFAYLIKNIVCKNKSGFVAIFCVIMFVLSYVSDAIIPFRLPFTIDIAFLGTAFFLMGHLCGSKIEWLFENKKYFFDIVWFVIAIVLFVLCNIYKDPVCYMYINEYNDFPFMVVCAASGTLLTFIVSKYLLLIVGKISLIRNIILWYSINSLAVFPIHLTIKVLSIPLLSQLGLNNWVCVFVIMFVLTIPVVNIINNYFPFLLGVFNSKKTKINR